MFWAVTDFAVSLFMNFCSPPFGKYKHAEWVEIASVDQLPFPPVVKRWLGDDEALPIPT